MFHIHYVSSKRQELCTQRQSITSRIISIFKTRSHLPSAYGRADLLQDIQCSFTYYLSIKNINERPRSQCCKDVKCHISNSSTQKCQTARYCGPHTFKQSVSLAHNTTLCRQQLQYLVHSYLHMKFKASDRAVHASETSIQ